MEFTKQPSGSAWLLNLFPFGGSSKRRLVGRIETEPGGVLLEYRLGPDPAALDEVLLLDSELQTEGTFRDGLYTTTCFEAFLMEADGPGYLEYNFSPRGDWTCYRFTSYRAGREPVHSLRSPFLAAQLTPDGYSLRARLDGPNRGDLRLRAGLTAVLELRGGEKEFWAPVHPGARPDFHDPRGFTCTFPV